MTHDLGVYLDAQFRGETLDGYVHRTSTPRLPLYHSVGASDPIEDRDIDHRVGDGLPETLPEWIRYNGVTNIKIKLEGNDLAWDIDRVLRISRVTAATQSPRGVERWVYSLDFNERCPNVEYLLDFLRRIKSQDPAGFDRIQYIEQPTARNLKANPDNVMHEAARIKPVVIDESLTTTRP
jgi:L-alanine-DL-glutamate epimerase-like enolase superfamily enzyme